MPIIIVVRASLKNAGAWSGPETLHVDKRVRQRGFRDRRRRSARRSPPLSGITYETRDWERDPDDLALIPKSRRRKILPIYEAAVPASIAAR